MNKFLVLCLSILSLSAFSSEGYKLDMNIMFDGKVVSKPQIIVQKGKKTTLTQEDSATKVMTEVSIVATEGEAQGNKGILLNFDIVHTDGEAKNIKVSHKVLVREGKEALFGTSNINGDNKMKLKFTATRVTL